MGVDRVRCSGAAGCKRDDATQIDGYGNMRQSVCLRLDMQPPPANFQQQLQCTFGLTMKGCYATWRSAAAADGDMMVNNCGMVANFDQSISIWKSAL